MTKEIILKVQLERQLESFELLDVKVAISEALDKLGQDVRLDKITTIE